MLRGKDRPVPAPTYMSDVQKAEYLRGLRTSNPPRPSGSRPPPPSKFTSSRSIEQDENPLIRRPDGQTVPRTSNSFPNMPITGSSHARTDSGSISKTSLAGRPLVRQPSPQTAGTSASSDIDEETLPFKSSVSYMERGTRWMEKQEARSLRMALEDMDQVEERRVYSAAQDEAAELVWKHRNPDDPSAQPGAPYRNPDMRRDYHAHLRKGSYQRSQSQDALPDVSERKPSSSSHIELRDSTSTSNKRKSMDFTCDARPPAAEVIVEKRRTPSGKSYGGLAEAVADDIAKAHRRSSSGSHRILSGEKKKMFMDPNDQIWEDPQEEQTQRPQVAEPLKSSVVTQSAHVRKNPFARVRMQADKLERSRSEPIVSTHMHHSVEIQRNPPSQSRRPWYTSNEPSPLTPTASHMEASDEVPPKVSPTNNSKEIRDDDIRAATSKRRNDYSPKLPRPTMVSDKPGRPIVSFQDWKPKEVVLEGIQATPFSSTGADPSKTRQPTRPSNTSLISDPTSNLSSVPHINIEEPQTPPVPTIFTPNERNIPSIVLPDEPDLAESANVQSTPVTPVITVEPPVLSNRPPEINISDSEASPTQTMPFAQPWPTPAARRPLPTQTASSPLPSSKAHYTPSIKPSGTLCGHCALPIAGRILSAGGERFHPSCFVCHQCHTNLELVAFYPEPDKARAERLARIEARQAGTAIPIDELWRQEVEDGDGSLRFFCHLDFHELFSPRCKSCKTPIEGEVIVACGAEWHAGHFFCAQCGDPFDSKTPFVEKDGYAWCLGCHTNRYSSKCRKCKKPVTDTVVKALGHDWHESCFVCTECNGGFANGKYFLRGTRQDPVCVDCEERRLKA